MATGLTVRFLSYSGSYWYYTGTDNNGAPLYSTLVKEARLMNERQATHAAQAVASDGHHPEIELTTLDD